MAICGIWGEGKKNIYILHHHSSPVPRSRAATLQLTSLLQRRGAHRPVPVSSNPIAHWFLLHFAFTAFGPCAQQAASVAACRQCAGVLQGCTAHSSFLGRHQDDIGPLCPMFFPSDALSKRFRKERSSDMTLLLTTAPPLCASCTQQVERVANSR